MRIHFIAIGGSIMHNLALALDHLGHIVTGSDDIVYDPARSKLAARGLLPKEFGWFEERIDSSIDLVILGMHAHSDNTELKKAQALDIEIMSFPEYLGRHAQDKTTVAICGSHGKTTTTSMVMHILNASGLKFDYAVGAQLQGFDTMVGLSDAPIMVIEGDEYLSSALDASPKFLHYDPDITVITGVEWDHINVFPTYEIYLNSFKQLIALLSEKDVLILNHFDENVTKNLGGIKVGSADGYYELPYKRDGEHYTISVGKKELELRLFGQHNYENLMAAWMVCKKLGLDDYQIMEAMNSFQLPDKRMNILKENENIRIIRDYAHSPSKVRACVRAMTGIKSERQRIAVVEIHTYSSLNKDFLPLYDSVLNGIDHAFVFYNPKNLEIKRLPHINPDYIKSAFGRSDLTVETDIEQLKFKVSELLGSPTELLLMSSSNFGGLDWTTLAEG
jgi:UDP-N-acetylmuramate: L-alanyl-gamma-D-glutamyl-meso-diaminopimelate ligase